VRPDPHSFWTAPTHLTSSESHGASSEENTPYQQTTTHGPPRAQLTQLRRHVLNSLRRQGFRIRSGRLVPPPASDKEQLRRLHAEAVRHQREQARARLERYEDRLLTFIAQGSEVVPERLCPRLVLVEPDSFDELLFRYVRLHWSIPTSAGYGRRLRFLIYDDTNGKLIGLLGLSDPVFNLGPRDAWIGWTSEMKNQRLRYVMDLFVLGAVPPYSHLLCGKLVALLAISREVQEAFRRKYQGQRTIIRGETFSGSLALLTTTSALGRSSIYNRLSYQGQLVFFRLGYTRGSGEFHLSNGCYAELRRLVLAHCQATAKHSCWGQGFRNKREVVRKALALLGLRGELIYHGVPREIFAAPLAANATAFLRGENQRLRRQSHTAAELFDWFRQRWLLPRAARDPRYRDFDRETYRLWGPS
jgi:hypothetical protein